MIGLEGFNFNQKLFETEKEIFYRGIRSRDNLPVLARFLRVDHPSTSDLNQLQHDFNISRSLDLPGVAAPYSIENAGLNKILIIEDYGAILLNEHLRSHSFSLQETLDIIITIATILGEIHRKNIIHKDIKPGNIFIHPETKKVKITGFRIASEIQKETGAAKNPEELEGSLAYISPEQTGRMNRSVDFRSDLYSLGIIFYEMLTGSVPFDTKDPMELVHSHIAIAPVPPHTENPNIPETVSNIVIKLLAKAAEDRYQSISGLKSDLEKCSGMLKTGKKIEAIEIGKNDIPEWFHIPEKLYGREKEVETLFDEFSIAANEGFRMIFFAGPPGIGKSFLINEIQRPLVKKNGFFISGKFEQYKQNIPYSSFIQAFQDLIHQLLTGSDETIALWKESILSSLGANGQIILDVIPDLKLIIGLQQPVPELPSSENQNRFNFVFRNFIKTLAGKDHPLVLFLDDLQWIDSASLKLLQAISTGTEIKNLLIIGAYRDPEVNESHPLMIILDEINQKGDDFKTVVLKRLESDHINQLISETLSIPLEHTAELAALIKLKSGGNPFFINKFLTSLYEEKFITYGQNWSFDIKKIRQAGITDNVIELMAERVKKLPENMRNVLKVASCIGVKFDLATLFGVYDVSEDELRKGLTGAIDEGMIIKMSIGEQFAHNRVREAVYSLIEEEERTQIHYNIGKVLLKRTPDEKLDDTIFEIVEQFNRAIVLISSEEEKTDLARLNFKAALRAKSSTAYEAANKFLENSRNLLPPDSWESEYTLSRQLYTECGEIAFLAGEYKASELFFDAVLQNAKTVLEKIPVYQIKIANYTILQKLNEAVEFGKKALKMIGFNMPQKANRFFLFKESLSLYMNIRKKNVDDLVNLKELKDPQKLAISSILTSCTIPSYIGVPDYWPILILKLVNLSLKHGNSHQSAFIYVFYSVMLIGKSGDIEKGYSFGKLALQVLEKFNARELKSKVYFLFGSMINHWKNHVRKDLEYLLEAHQSGIETGDLEFASYAVNHYFFKLFFIGTPLDDLKEKFEQYNEVMEKLQKENASKLYKFWNQFVVNLSEMTENKLIIKGGIADEEELLTHWITVNDMNSLGFHSVAKQILFYINDSHEQAIQAAQTGNNYLSGMIGMYFVAEHYFYYSLSLLAHYPAASPKEQKKYLVLVKTHQNKMKKWADLAPQNFQHKYLLVEAERFRIARGMSAVKLYDKAISLARRNKFLQDEAIANECAAKFYLDRKIEKLASFYMTEAYYCFSNWGAKIKIKALMKKYAPIIDTPSTSGKPEPESSVVEGAVLPVTTTSFSGKLLDISTIMKASHTIAGEIVIEKLLRNLVRVMMENAGAEKGVLILKKDESFYIEAEGVIGNEEITVLQSVPLEKNRIVPEAIIRYVNRTRASVVLDDAASDKFFSRDWYINTNLPKSILCMPVIHQNKLTAILYLENNLSKGTFTSERQETLKLLAAQAAISLENASLYQNLRQEIEERQRAEEALRDSEEKYRGIVENSASGIFQADSSGRLITVNPAFAQIFGYDSPDDLITGIFSIKDELNADPEKFAVFMEQIQNNGFVKDFKTSSYKKDGSIIYVSMNVHTVTNDTKKPSYYEGTLEDVTQKKRAEEFKIARDAAEAAALAKSEFIANMSHEIRTPMNSILGFSELLEEQIEDENHKEYLSAITSSGRTLLHLINDILDLSKIEAGMLELQYHSVNLHSVCHEIRNIFSRETGSKKIDFLVEIDESLPRGLLLDETRLRQVLFNLVGNAVKFTDEGYIKLSVFKERIIEENSSLELSISVQDTGIGIAEDQLDRIFEAFKQQSGQSAAKYGGTGLGLSITKRLVEMMNGSISVKSRPGKGSSFIVQLKDVSISAVKDTPAASPESSIDSIQFEEVLILIADDNPSNLVLLKKFLKIPNITVIEAANGKEAVDLAVLYQPNLVFMDIRMPVMDGYDAARILKEVDASKEIPIVAITASVMEKSEEKIKAAGFNGYLKKPVSKKELFTEMIRFLPYTSRETPSPIKEQQSPPEFSFDSLPPEILSRLPELARILNNEIMPTWEKMSKKYFISEIEKFAARIKELGFEYDIDILKDWSERLGKQVKSYDMENLPNTLGIFAEIVKKIDRAAGHRRES
ncbi:MAG: AAA family ATPase [bacterium]|nr:AAA family ATPase [bacterium]